MPKKCGGALVKLVLTVPVVSDNESFQNNGPKNKRCKYIESKFSFKIKILEIHVELKNLSNFLNLSAARKSETCIVIITI